MEIQIHSTEKTVTINGVPARIWEGVTAAGVECHCYITRIACKADADATEFERELQEHQAPSVEIQSIPLRMIL